jgi:hypothetical protein
VRSCKRPELASLVGALLIAALGRRYGLDRSDCAHYPSLAGNLGASAVYLAGIALLTMGWLGLRARARLTDPLWPWAALVHLCAMIGPPFLSRDPLAYAAYGRAVGVFHQASTAPVPWDPLVSLLTASVRGGSSVYAIGFNQLAAGVARLAGDDLALHLRLYQLIGMISVLLAGALLGRRLAPLVWFCPLAIVEATQNGHNDALMMIAVAGFAALTVRRHPLAATLSLGGALLIKASAWIPLSIRLFTDRRVRILMIAAAPLALLMLRGSNLMALLGSPHDPYDYCTRSIECLPRVLLRWVFAMPTAAWVIGLCFRALAALWLGHVSLRAARDGQLLRWMASGVFVYFLLLHGWSQSWYLLMLLPLVPFAGERVRPAMMTAMVSAVAYYAVAIPFECSSAPLPMAIRDLLGALITIVPPVLVWAHELHGARGARARAQGVPPGDRGELRHR